LTVVVLVVVARVVVDVGFTSAAVVPESSAGVSPFGTVLIAVVVVVF
jgi:hypothetical protein